MRKLFSIAAVLLTALPVLAANPYKADAGPYAVATLECDWKDAARNVTVPVKIDYPKDLASIKEPLPLIIFSHGLGGSRETNAIWGEHWASHGYIVIHPTHVGSDTSILLKALENGAQPTRAAALAALKPAASAEDAIKRCKDVSFILDEAARINAGRGVDAALAPFKDKIDLQHIGMSGHSFGAQTTLSVSGQTFPLARMNGLADPRITAAIAMSPQPGKVGDQKAAFASIKIPILHLTGTNDESPFGDLTPADRTLPFKYSATPGTLLVVFQGATHMSFSPTKSGVKLNLGQRDDAAASRSPADEKLLQSLVRQSTTAYWDAHLKAQKPAADWLTAEFPKLLGKAGTFEAK